MRALVLKRSVQVAGLGLKTTWYLTAGEPRTLS